jgi:hypothetical protein
MAAKPKKTNGQSMVSAIGQGAAATPGVTVKKKKKTSRGK